MLRSQILAKVYGREEINRKIYGLWKFFVLLLLFLCILIVLATSVLTGELKNILSVNPGLSEV